MSRHQASSDVRALAGFVPQPKALANARLEVLRQSDVTALHVAKSDLPVVAYVVISVLVGGSFGVLGVTIAKDVLGLRGLSQTIIAGVAAAAGLVVGPWIHLRDDRARRQRDEALGPVLAYDRRSGIVRCPRLNWHVRAPHVVRLELVDGTLRDREHDEGVEISQVLMVVRDRDGREYRRLLYVGTGMGTMGLDALVSAFGWPVERVRRANALKHVLCRNAPLSSDVYVTALDGKPWSNKSYALVGDGCPACNYDLRGVRQWRCPECGLDVRDY